MARLKKGATLKDLQKYVLDMCVERGWAGDTYLEKMFLLTEEMGELAKAIRQHSRLYEEKGADKKRLYHLEEEFADVLSYLVDLANYFNVDLEKAFRKKEKINARRKWSS